MREGGREGERRACEGRERGGRVRGGSERGREGERRACEGDEEEGMRGDEEGERGRNCNFKL